MKPPKNQYTLGELMGLVALFAVGFALLTTSAALLGAGVLIVVPGFVLGRVRGGTGIIGGIISGCVIPLGAATAWAVIDFFFGSLAIDGVFNVFPALFLVFVISLVWSGVASSILYVLDRRLQGTPRSQRVATGPVDAGIRFLSDEDRPGPVPPSRGGTHR